MPSSEISTKVTRMFVLHGPLSPGSPPAPHLRFYQVKIRTHHSVRLRDPFFMLSNLWLLKLWKEMWRQNTACSKTIETAPAALLRIPLWISTCSQLPCGLLADLGALASHCTESWAGDVTAGTKSRSESIIVDVCGAGIVGKHAVGAQSDKPSISHEAECLKRFD